MEMETVRYGGWRDCVRLNNGEVELIATTAVGPRLIRFGFVGGENEFHEFPEMLGLTGGDEWRIYGGHRLWHSPEAKPRSYALDNGPVEARMEGDTLHLLQPTEPTTGIRKEMRVTMDRQSTQVGVLHRLTNQGLWPVTLAAWALSVMARGGRAVVPQSQRETPDNLLPNRTLVLWPYTDLRDPRLELGSRYLSLQQDPRVSQPIKIGVSVDDGWAGYVRHGNLFLKRFIYQAGAAYPDYGSSVETYTNADFLELETLGPLQELAPGQSAEHIEDWYLFRDADASDEAAVERTVLPRVRETDQTAVVTLL
jgi:hypothetical protein